MTILDLPANVIEGEARLPAIYESAKTALAQCDRIDECQMWADKAEALASYAKQANDDGLRRMADRIQARAIRRAGELLREIAPQQGARTDQLQEGTLPKSRTQAATDAGLSEHQRKTALRVANVPADEFEHAVEGESPPSVTALAERGTVPRPADVDLAGRTVDEFKAATRAIGGLQYFEKHIAEADPAMVVRGADQSEREAILRPVAAKVRDWIERLENELGRA